MSAFLLISTQNTVPCCQKYTPNYLIGQKVTKYFVDDENIIQESLYPQAVLLGKSAENFCPILFCSIRYLEHKVVQFTF